MDILSKLFGNQYRVRVLRLFYLNSDKTLAPKEIVKLTKVPSSAVSRELRLLNSVGFLKSGVRTDEYLKKVKKEQKIFTKKVSGFMLSSTFPLLLALRYLVVTASPVSREKMLKYFKSKGKIKAVVLGGVFNENGSTGLDMLVVGNGVAKTVLESFVERVGADVGKELVWAYMPESEFAHRLGMRDRFLREFFDNPHEFLVDKMGLSSKEN